MRVVFLGTPEFAVPSLKALLDPTHHDCELVGVITQPDRPAGRGHKLTPPPVRLVAEESNVPFFQPHRLRDDPEALRFLKEKKPQLVVVVAFGQILPPDFFNYPSLGSINVHASLLPRYRGAAPMAHALMNGEKETGVTIMKIDQGMDTGDILSQAAVSVGENTTGEELEDILALKGAELLIETIPGYAEGEIQARPQNHEQASYAPRIKKEDARIDWNRPAPQIHNRIRAFNPWPTAVADFRGARVKIWRSQKMKENGEDLRPSGRVGTIAAVGKDKIVVECGRKTFLSLKELQLPNRKRVSARDFVNGTSLRPGELLT